MKTFILHTTAFMLLTSGFVHGQTILNGSFETGVVLDPGGLQIDSVNSTSIPGWTVDTGNIDYVPSTRWVAADGNRCLDLSGVNAGSIEQVVAGFTPGTQYRLTFLLAGNPEQPPYPKNLRVFFGSATQDYQFDGVYSTSNLGWVTRTLDVTANSTSMTVRFLSLNDGWSGPALDNVSVAAVPEPTTISFGLLMVPALLVQRRFARARIDRQ
jgi:choice-of-anchor C domain-containing protein